MDGTSGGGASGVGGGGVLWRSRAGAIEVVLVRHRATGRWELPKGKAEAGEAPSDTARREVAEEAGLDCRLVEYLGEVHFRDGDRWRAVRYWLMELVDDRPEPRPREGTEIAEARWSEIGGTRSPACQPYDALVLTRVAEVLARRGVALPAEPVPAGNCWRLVRDADPGGRWVAEGEAGEVVARLAPVDMSPGPECATVVVPSGGWVAGTAAGEVCS